MASRKRPPWSPRILARRRATQILLMSQSELARLPNAARQCVGSQQSGVQLRAGLRRRRVLAAGARRLQCALRGCGASGEATHAVPLVDCEAPAHLLFRRRPVCPAALPRWDRS
jgi:hypothetical protein